MTTQIAPQVERWWKLPAEINESLPCREIFHGGPDGYVTLITPGGVKLTMDRKLLTPVEPPAPPIPPDPQDGLWLDARGAAWVPRWTGGPGPFPGYCLATGMAPTTTKPWLELWRERGPLRLLIALPAGYPAWMPTLPYRGQTANKLFQAHVAVSERDASKVFVTVGSSTLEPDQAEQLGAALIVAAKQARHGQAMAETEGTQST